VSTFIQLLTLCCLLSTTIGCTSAERVRFAAIGDTPYYPSDTELDSLVDAFSVMANQKIPFVIHIGDIFGGRAECTADRYRVRADVFAKAPMPLLITIGDNEFNDCVNADEARMFFRNIILGNPEPTQLIAGASNIFPPIRVTRQKKMIENMHWSINNVGFIMLALPTMPGDYPLDAKKIKEILDANIIFVSQYFNQANLNNRDAVVVMMHSDPTRCRVVGCPEFNRLLKQTIRAFGKPVLLINGSEHSPIFKETGYQNIVNWAHLRPGSEPEERWPEISFLPVQKKFEIIWHEIP